MEKIAFCPKIPPDKVQLDAPIHENLQIIASELKMRVQDLVAVVLDRPRHQHIVDELRESGCGIRLISDGDVAAAIAPSLPDSGVNLYLGIGGSPEAVLAAAAIKCLGGEQLCRMWPKSDEERKHLLQEGYTQTNFNKIWTVNEMAKGDHIIFTATGISDSPMLRGIRYRDRHCITESILMRARNQTVRRIEAYHDIYHKTIRFGSNGQEVEL